MTHVFAEDATAVAVHPKKGIVLLPRYQRLADHYDSTEFELVTLQRQTRL
jgi:hypothetical protein